MISKSKFYSAQALVLRARDLGEADKILTLYTKEEGKVQAVAKGVRKATSRLRGGVQLFSHTRLLLYRGRSLDTVSQSETINAFAGICDDLTILTYASYLVELLDSAVPDREPHPGIFRLTVSCLDLLRSQDPELVARYYEIRLLSFLGYKPYLDGCMVCGNFEGRGPFRLAAEEGGIVCHLCSKEAFSQHPRPQREGILWISAGSVSALNRMASMDPAYLSRLKMSEAMKKEMDTALGTYLEYYLERGIKSRRMLKILE